MPFLAVFAMRADYLGALQAAEGLVVGFEEFSLKPMPQSRIPQIIRGPAKVSGLTIEASLVERAVRDAATADALPLLAFVLRCLYDRFGSQGHLSSVHYDALGDPAKGLSTLENAVRQAADDVLKEMRPEPAELTALRNAFVPAMVHLNDDGEYVRKAAAWEELPEEARPILTRLVDARLLVSRESDGVRMVEVAHEALLRKWSLLREWLDEDRQFLAWLREIDRKCAAWRNARPRRRRDLLLFGWPLTQARAWLQSKGKQIGEDVKTYIETSYLAGYYLRGFFWMLAAILVPVFAIGIAHGHVSNLLQSVVWPTDPVSTYLIRNMNLLRLLDFATTTSLLVVLFTCALRYWVKIRGTGDRR